MKKVLMILTMGLFLGTIGYTSVAVANTTDTVECEGDHDKKKCKNKDCKDKDCKKEGCDKDKKGDKKACCSKGKTASEEKKACCAKDKAKAEAKTTEKKSCHKEGKKKACCAKKGEHK